MFSPGVADPVFWSRFEDWRDTRAGWRAALEHLPEIGVRGPNSKRLLEEAGLRNVIVTGDPALALRRPAAASTPGRRAVAINVGRANGLVWGSEERVLAALADAAARLSANVGTNSEEGTPFGTKRTRDAGTPTMPTS